MPTSSAETEHRTRKVAGLPFAQYLLDPAWSRSDLKLFLENSPFKARWLKEHPAADEDTEALLFGRAFHHKLLEPELFERTYHVASISTKAKGKGWEKEVEAAEGRELLRKNQGDMLNAMAEAVHRAPALMRLLIEPGENELSCFWKDGASGLPQKCRFDRLILSRTGVIVLDLKTAASLNPVDYNRSISKFAYHEQAAQYADGARAVTGNSKVDFIHLVVEKEPPHEAVLVKFPQDLIQKGRESLARARSTIVECQRRNHWPSWSERAIQASLPPYHDTSTPSAYNPFLED